MMIGTFDREFEGRRIDILLSDVSYGIHKCRYKLPRNHPYVLFSLFIILASVIVLAVFGTNMNSILLLLITSVPIAALASMFFHLAQYPRKNIMNAMLYTDLIVERRRLQRKKRLVQNYSNIRNDLCLEDFELRYRARSMGDITETMDKKYINEMLQKIDTLIEEF